jgi:D-beta-D-heptose 7-phosphate kinase/D-beta-D-heptose 1-phosphate adenosyltransferase
MILSDGAEIVRIPTLAKEVYDVSGAGDTMMAALALAIAASGDLKTSALISNYAAGVAVGKSGTATVTREELLETINERGIFSYV